MYNVLEKQIGYERRLIGEYMDLFKIGKLLLLLLLCLNLELNGPFEIDVEFKLFIEDEKKISLYLLENDFI